MELFYKVTLNLLLYFVFVMAIGEHSGRMRNEAVVLSSVYDAMRNNYVDESGPAAAAVSGGHRSELVNYELRNKRNINDRWDVDHGQREEPVYLQQQPPYSKSDGYNNRNSELDTGEDTEQSGNELICSVYKPNHHDERYIGQNPFLDHNNWKFFSTVGFFMGKAVKFVLSGIALVSLPIIFLVGVGIPLKILLSLKALTLTNSVVFGSVIYRLLNRFFRPFPRPNAQINISNNPIDDTDEDDSGVAVNAPVVKHHHHILNKLGSSLEVDPENDYEDNEEKLQKILESLKNKNKDW